MVTRGSKEDPYRESPYDASGMPLGAETVDYDDKKAVAEHTVKDKYIEPLPLFSDDDDFHESKIEKKKFNPALNNTAIQFPGHRIHKKHEEDLGTGIPEVTDEEPDKLDLDDPKEHEKLAKEDPKETNKTKLESDKVAHSDKKDDTDFLKGI